MGMKLEMTVVLGFATKAPKNYWDGMKYILEDKRQVDDDQSLISTVNEFTVRGMRVLIVPTSISTKFPIDSTLWEVTQELHRLDLLPEID